MASAWATEGLWLILIGAALAGVVRGFAGFGTAMIFLPFASAVLPPVHALLAMMVMDLVGPLPLVPRALRDATRRHLVWLSLGMVWTLPLGLILLTHMKAEVYRTVLSLVILASLALILLGWRYRGPLSAPILAGTGSLGGFLGGAVGLPGPPVIVMTMASTMGPAAIRATNMLYLILCDMVLALTLLWLGRLSVTPLAIGVLAIAPYMAGGWVGAMFFDPARERLYRAVAFCVIAAAALSALPVWG